MQDELCIQTNPHVTNSISKIYLNMYQTREKTNGKSPSQLVVETRPLNLEYG